MVINVWRAQRILEFIFEFLSVNSKVYKLIYFRLFSNHIMHRGWTYGTNADEIDRVTRPQLRTSGSKPECPLHGRQLPLHYLTHKSKCMLDERLSLVPEYNPNPREHAGYGGFQLGCDPQ